MSNRVNNVTKPFWLFLIGGLIWAMVSVITIHLLTTGNDVEQYARLVSTIAIVVTYMVLTILLAYDQTNRLRLLLTVVSIGVVLGLFMWLPDPNNDNLIPFQVLLLVFASYAILCLVQGYHEHDYRLPNYQTLFSKVWGNIPILFAAFIFLSLAQAILSLCAGLFLLLNIHVFIDLYQGVYFQAVLNALLYALGLYICSQQKRILVSIRAVMLAFFKYMLPILAIFFVGFVFIAIAQLITHHLHVSINLHYEFLLMLVLIILFVNAVYQDGSKASDLHHVFRWSINALVLLMPILWASAAWYYPSPFYTQQGIGFFIIMMILACYTVCYNIGIWQHNNWLHALKHGNVMIAWVLIAAACLMSTSPLLELLPEHGHSAKHAQVHKQQLNTTAKGLKQTKAPDSLPTTATQSREKTQWVNAGPIMSNDGRYKSAKMICPGVCNRFQSWTGQWRTINKAEVVSVCECVV